MNCWYVLNFIQWSADDDDDGILYEKISRRTRLQGFYIFYTKNTVKGVLEPRGNSDKRLCRNAAAAAAAVAIVDPMQSTRFDARYYTKGCRDTA